MTVRSQPRRRKRTPIIQKVVKGKLVLIESEFTVQCKYFDWLRVERPSARPYCFAVPNGGSRHVLEAVNLKRQGVTKGILDTITLIPSGIYHGLLIEFKRADKREPSKEQAEKIVLFRSVGYKCEICATLKEAQDVFDEYIGGSNFLKEELCKTNHM